jgi:hypothetical protein
MCCVRHHPPVPVVSWWGPLQWVIPLQPSIRSAGQSSFSLLPCCCSGSSCNMALLWVPSLSWRLILFSWMTSLLNDTFRSSCRVWLITYKGTFVIIRSILDWLRCIMAICDCWRIPIIRFHRSRYALWLSYYKVLYFLAMREIFFRWPNISLLLLGLSVFSFGLNAMLTLAWNPNVGLASPNIIRRWPIMKVQVIFGLHMTSRYSLYFSEMNNRQQAIA